MPNLRYHYKHKKIFPNMWFGVVLRHIYIKILIYDFLETLQIRQIICASLGEFLCAEFAILLQTQENMWFGVVPRYISVDPNIQFS